MVEVDLFRAAAEDFFDEEIDLLSQEFNFLILTKVVFTKPGVFLFQLFEGARHDEERILGRDGFSYLFFGL